MSAGPFTTLPLYALPLPPPPRYTPRMTPPRRRATIKDLAAAVGVAPSTVSNAYNRPDQLSAELRERIFAAAETVGYGGPDPAARGLRTRRTGGVAVLLGGPLANAFGDPVTVATLTGLAGELAASGTGLALTLVPTPEAGAPVALPAADGLIVLCDDEADPLLALALRSPGPTVLVDAVFERREEGGGRRDGKGIPSSSFPSPTSYVRVGVDDTIAARSAIGHLLALGHLRVAVLTDRLPAREEAGGGRDDASPRPSASLPPPPSSARQRARLQGYQIGIEAVGLAWSDVPVAAAGADGEEAGRAAARTLLERSPRPTAILATSDALALGALAAARDLGVPVPGELSVVGFDDTLTKPTSPALTTVRQPHQLKGRAAARALLALLRDDPAPAPERLLPKLVVRGSSGPAPREEG